MLHFLSKIKKQTIKNDIRIRSSSPATNYPQFNETNHNSNKNNKKDKQKKCIWKHKHMEIENF